MRASAQTNPGLQKILSAAFGLQYGLMMVIVCGAELFTGNTATMTAAFWEGKATAGQVVKNWVCSYSGECHPLSIVALHASLMSSGQRADRTATVWHSSHDDSCVIRANYCSRQPIVGKTGAL